MSDDPIAPIPAPTKLMIEAIAAAQDLVGRLEPLTEHEAEVRDRAAKMLNALLTLAKADDPSQRGLYALALSINLGSHPDPAQAKHDHLVLPLLGIVAVPNSRGLKAWMAQWLDQANTAVSAEVEARRDSETAEAAR